MVHLVWDPLLRHDHENVQHIELVEVLSSSSKGRKLLEGSLDDQKKEKVCIYLIDKLMSSYSCRKND